MAKEIVKKRRGAKEIVKERREKGDSYINATVGGRNRQRTYCNTPRVERG